MFFTSLADRAIYAENGLPAFLIALIGQGSSFLRYRSQVRVQSSWRQHSASIYSAAGLAVEDRSTQQQCCDILNELDKLASHLSALDVSEHSSEHHLVSGTTGE